MQETYKTLARISTLKKDALINYQMTAHTETDILLERFILAVTSKQRLDGQNADLLRKFLSYMAEARGCKLSPDIFLGNPEDMSIVAAAEQKTFFFDSQRRAYCIYGKGVSVYKRKNKIKAQDGENRSELVSMVESAIFQMQNLTTPKGDSPAIQDLLLQYDLPDESVEPVLQSNQIFSPFVPLPFALVLVLPAKCSKPEFTINFMKSSLLHVYLDQAILFNKVTTRQVFYKNSIFKGIYFVEEGEVEATSGRVVARGWVTNGHCRSSGYGWRFKPLPFLKWIGRNDHIWKQFVNDLVLNHEYPFKLSYILNLDEQPQIKQYGEKRSARRNIKLPRIGNMSLDYVKLGEIEKMKHYDDRLDDICEFKRKLLQKKIGGVLNKHFDPIVPNDDPRRKMFLSPSRMLPEQRNSSDNILIKSVLRRLESLVEQAPVQASGEQRRRNIKISPMQLNEKSRVAKKKRYNQT